MEFAVINVLLGTKVSQKSYLCKVCVNGESYILLFHISQFLAIRK